MLERQHTLASEFLGHDSVGNPQFDTKRTDKNAVDSIGDTAVEFIKGWGPAIDLIVPVPPSRKRAYQPVIEIAKAIGTRLPKPVGEVAVNKVKETPELKDVYDYEQRIKLLDGAFKVDAGAVQNKQILLVDDLYRSGATATLVAKGSARRRR